jgi:hypothetical protein
MAEIWGAAIMVVGAVASSQAAKKKAEAERKANKADTQELTEEGAKLNAQLSGYEAGIENYYKQKERFEQQRGLDQFRQFSTMGEFAPGVNDQGGRIVMPEAPVYGDFAVEEEEPEQNKNNPQDKKKDSTLKKAMKLHDPLGAALGIFG